MEQRRERGAANATNPSSCQRDQLFGILSAIAFLTCVGSDSYHDSCTMVLHRIKDYFRKPDLDHIFLPEPVTEQQQMQHEQEMRAQEGEECVGCRLICGFTIVTLSAAMPVLSYRQYQEVIRPCDPKDPLVAYGPKTTQFMRPKQALVLYFVFAAVGMAYGTAILTKRRFRPVDDLLGLDTGL